MERSKFLTFDIVNFHSFILEKLPTDTILFIKQHIDIDDDSIAVIYHCRKSLLFSKDGAWKINNGSLFDVTMGSYYGVKICEIVGESRVFVLEAFRLTLFKRIRQK